MAIYAIGDLHGQLIPLKKLLAKIEFNPAKDTLWFTGDLVNRGPDSLGCLRFVRDLGDRAKMVLGNHDLALLAYAHGHRLEGKDQSTFEHILRARDSRHLIKWLQSRPLMHHDPKLPFTLVHAGVPPCWTLEQALHEAARAEALLQSTHAAFFLKKHLYGNLPNTFSKSHSQVERTRFTLNAMTRMRYVEITGTLEFDTKCAPNKAPKGVIPWYAFANHPAHEDNLVFGHWAALGDLGTQHPHIQHIDTGCAWGGKLTALRIADSKGQIKLKRIQCDC